MVLDLLMSDLIGNTVAPVLTSAMHVCIADARSERQPHRMPSPKHTDARTNTQ